MDIPIFRGQEGPRQIGENHFFLGVACEKSVTAEKKCDSYHPFGLPHTERDQTTDQNTKNLYQGKEWQTQLALNLYDFHARQYDPTTGRFTSIDPASQFASGYVGMGNMPTMGVDPDGRIFFAYPTIGFSKKGGLDLGFVAGVGIPGKSSFQIGGGYNFKSGEGYGFVSATNAGNTHALSYTPSSGFTASYSFGLSKYSGLPISTNALSAGISYNLTHRQPGANISAWAVNGRGNWTFNPSVGAAIMPGRFDNLIAGRGFRTNAQVGRLQPGDPAFKRIEARLSRRNAGYAEGWSITVGPIFNKETIGDDGLGVYENATARKRAIQKHTMAGRIASGRSNFLSGARDVSINAVGKTGDYLALAGSGIAPFVPPVGGAMMTLGAGMSMVAGVAQVGVQVTNNDLSGAGYTILKTVSNRLLPDAVRRIPHTSQVQQIILKGTSSQFLSAGFYSYESLGK